LGVLTVSSIGGNGFRIYRETLSRFVRRFIRHPHRASPRRESTSATSSPAAGSVPDQFTRATHPCHRDGPGDDRRAALPATPVRVPARRSGSIRKSTPRPLAPAYFVRDLFGV
ncbi:hypothetical protein ABLN67_15740, partial [Mycobacterium tuberculosis]